ncbi:MAG: OmpA family protein [Deltaproteobacteria bacterium]
MNNRWIAAGVGLTFLTGISGCAPPQTKTGQGALYGTAGGAAAGAIIGQAIGHDTKGTLIGTAIGAAVGGLAGAGIGRYMDNQEQALRNAMAHSNATSIQRTGDAIAVTFKGDVLFSTGSSAIQPGAYAEIDRMAQVLQQYPETRIRIEGHTDSTGSEQANLDLSQRRAEAVKNALISRGIAPERLTALGYGESRPIASNATPEGRQLNRRVEVFIEPRA